MWDSKGSGYWWRVSYLVAVPYMILTSLVAVRGQESKGAGNLVFQARGNMWLLLTTHWPDPVFCAPVYCSGARKCCSAYGIQWVVNTSATIPVAKWYQPVESPPSSWRRQRVQKGIILWLIWFPRHPWPTTHILLRKSCWYTEVSMYNSWQFPLLILVDTHFWSILCQLKIEACMNKKDIWWIMLFTSFFDSIQQNFQGFFFFFFFLVSLKCNCHHCILLYLESDKQACLHFENSTMKSNKHPNSQIRF